MQLDDRLLQARRGTGVALQGGGQVGPEDVDFVVGGFGPRDDVDLVGGPASLAGPSGPVDQRVVDANQLVVAGLVESMPVGEGREGTADYDQQSGVGDEARRSPISPGTGLSAVPGSNV